MTHIKRTINFLNFVNGLFEYLPLETHIVMNNLVDEFCGPSVERLCRKYSCNASRDWMSVMWSFVKRMNVRV